MSDNLNNSNNLPEGKSPPHNNKDEDTSGIPILCEVCGDTQCKTHYGAVTCVACSSFFQRYLQNQKEFEQCKKNERCMDELSVKNRTDCQHCRLQKCKDAGMCLQAAPSLERLTIFEMTNIFQQKMQEEANKSKLLLLPHPSSVDSAVTHCSSKTPSSSDTDASKDTNSERESVIVCPKKLNNRLSCGLDPPCGGSGIKSHAISSSARSYQPLTNECDDHMGLEDTVSTGAPQASLRDTISGEYLHVSTWPRSSPEQQEFEAEDLLNPTK